MLKRYKNSYFAYFLMYNFYFLSFSLFSTLISVYLLDMNFSAQDVSLVVSMSFLTSMLLQPIMGMLNDKIGIKKVTLTSFILVILGTMYFISVRDLIGITIGYSFIMMFINAVNPVLDNIAAKSPYTYGKIRIWGTIGYAMGTQLSGFVYQYISPQAISYLFIITMFISILGTCGVEINDGLSHQERDSFDLRSGLVSLFKNKTYLYFLVITALSSGVTNTAHTYIPAMLEHSGLSINMASTVISIAVICEAPLIFFSYLFMDKVKVKKLLYISLTILMLQYVIYGLDLGIWSKVIMTLVAKHAANMILIMVTFRITSQLVDRKILITALAIVQSVRSLGSIAIQSMTGTIVDHYGYGMMNFCWAALILVVIGLVYFIKLPDQEGYSLFS